MKKNPNQIRCFAELIQALSTEKVRKRVAIVWPAEEHTLAAVQMAADKNFIEPILLGSEEITAPFLNLPNYTCVKAESPAEAATLAVQMAKEGKADVIMKGFVSTDILLKAVLNKETGILAQGNILTHITVAEVPHYNKLLLFSDAAVIPFPTEKQREKQIEYIRNICHALQIETPKISLIHCSEKPDERHFPYTAHYMELKSKSEQGLLGNCIVDGPLDLKTSCSPEALHYKGIQSPIEGRADAIIFPNIEAGNVFYKTITLFSGALTAGILQGPQVPVVLPSRGDSVESKFYSLALATLTSKYYGI